MEKKSICLYFQIHQPVYLRKYHFFDIGKRHDYSDEFANGTMTAKKARCCYLPANQLMLKLIQKYGSNFKVAFSIPGLVLEQFEKYAPEVLDSFKALAETGSVEFLAETYSHSLASLVDEKEFSQQVKRHASAIKKYFGVTPKAFRNTELIYSDHIGEMVSNLGYKTMLTEGAKHILGWKSPNYVYTNALNPKLRILQKNSRLSDDIAFNFANRTWGEWPLTAEKYANWVSDAVKEQDVVNIFMNYDTIGEYMPANSGIFDFFYALPEQILQNDNIEFVTPSEAAMKHQPVAPLHVPFAISWTDEERDLTAWLGNELQNEAFEELYNIREDVLKLKDPDLMMDYDILQESDNFHYMSTKLFSDGSKQVSSPYESPYEAFINYMNIISDFGNRVEECKEKKALAKKKRSTQLEEKILK